MICFFAFSIIIINGAERTVKNGSFFSGQKLINMPSKWHGLNDNTMVTVKQQNKYLKNAIRHPFDMEIERTEVATGNNMTATARCIRDANEWSGNEWMECVCVCVHRFTVSGWKENVQKRKSDRWETELIEDQKYSRTIWRVQQQQERNVYRTHVFLLSGWPIVHSMSERKREDGRQNKTKQNERERERDIALKSVYCANLRVHSAPSLLNMTRSWYYIITLRVE